MPFAAVKPATSPGAVQYHHRAADQRSPNLGLLVLVTQNPFVRELINIAPKVYPGMSNTLKLAKSVDEAHALIANDKKGA